MKKKFWSFLAVSMLLTACGTDNAVSDNITSDTVSLQSETSQTKAAETSAAVTESAAETSETSAEQDANMNYAQIYDELLKTYCGIISGELSDDVLNADYSGVLEIVDNIGSEAALEQIGYAVEDVSGDGIPELIIGSMTDDYGSSIYSLYTVKDGSAVRTIEGREGDCTKYMGNGKFFYYGLDMARYSRFGTYAVSSDGTELSCIDYYYSCENDEKSDGVSFYHCPAGEGSNSADEEEISRDGFWQAESEYMQQTKKIGLVPLSSLITPDIEIRWADDLTECDVYLDEETEMQEKIVLRANCTVSDLKLLSLTFTDVDDEGNVRFETGELYSYDVLSPDRQLVIGLTIYGTIPSYGISYIDDKGSLKQFSIGISGMDGSLCLFEF